MRLIAILSMPGNNSWNGKWTGESENYSINVGNFGKTRAEELIGRYSYAFGDGWVASVEIRKAKPREKVSGKFCGYNWMVDSIIRDGKILSF